ncbi:glutaredoxin [Oleiphilus sp. HI0071]|jgi:glutaredoxin 3|nr:MULTISPECIES: glutaredoxin 3 [unclassified Oleiphilus]KZY60812.1 glutaredoxin [Oleiphilus sp. HI0065]KZY86424.1 glutaredoxin [Oleiphilus sp. HI0071]KZY89978.1 glutaredoxin [Oleiphilus sp. HI0073]KZZ44334.1 glutaredoxin [Oleiphilus sp. HI0118]KZZ57891.1 glutaredoxin [Oleiphilus sp. HI0122]KZZ65037.1 glutaredoxin [Oleiphilus sp. HI0130]KZZ80622.1 glutaredoxin [Oleiphilus sp. HI0133]
MSQDVVIYSSNYCPYCMRAKSLLKKKGVAFKELIVDGNPKLRSEMEQKAGRHTVPQIWIGSAHVGGCDELYAAERAGKLDKLLA